MGLPMTFDRFHRVTLLLTLGVASAFIGLNRWSNICGVYGDLRGRSYSVLGSERTAKYLFSFNYIPSNFDGLLIGSSISDNWDTSGMTLGRIYNASMSGANISEEALIAENVLVRGHLKNALFIIYPYMTESFGRKSAQMNPKEYWAPLGSLHLLRAYGEKLALARDWMPNDRNGYGYYRFVAPRVAPTALRDQFKPVDQFDVDERAFRQYRDLLASARDRGVRVIGVMPLVSARHAGARRLAFQRYHEQVLSLFRPREPILDLNGIPELQELALQDSSFQDGFHHSDEVAARIVFHLDHWLHQLPEPAVQPDFSATQKMKGENQRVTGS